MVVAPGPSVDLSSKISIAPPPAFLPGRDPFGHHMAAVKEPSAPRVMKPQPAPAPPAEPQPYWEYLERQNRRHDIIPTALPKFPDERDCEPLVYALRCRPASACGNEPPSSRPSYAMPRLGEVPPATAAAPRPRIAIVTTQRIMVPTGRIFDVIV